VTVEGIDTGGGGRSRDEAAHLVGFVRQDPTDQLVSSSVFDEVAFGPMNLGLAEGEVRGRVAGALGACGLAGYERRGVGELSGGELQRLAIAGVLAMEPAYLVLDEACAHLDGPSRAAVRSLLGDAGRGRSRHRRGHP
jgi:energy-coupling factor transport system ATP-binding protein